MSNSWLRWHHGTCEDGKFRMIARNAKVTVGNAIALWALLLEDASHPEHRGVCTRGEDFYGAILDLENDEVTGILSSMENIQMISVGHGNITICNWNKRQFESDISDRTNAERQKRYREKRKPNGQVTAVTESNGKNNGSVTAVTKSNGVTKIDNTNNIIENNNNTQPLPNVIVTAEKHQIQNTDTDTDTEKKERKCRGTRFALTQPPDDWIQFCALQRPDLDAGKTFDTFRDYWTARAGKEGVKLDWTATWRNWVRNQKSLNGANYGTAGKSKHEQGLASIAAARAERMQKQSGPAG